MGKGYYDIIKPLPLAHGCTFVRQGKGSYEIWQSPIRNRQFVLPYTVDSRHTAKGILKQAGINHKNP